MRVTPFGHEAVDVHETSEHLVGLTEPRLVTIQSNHDGALHCFVGEFAFAT